MGYPTEVSWIKHTSKMNTIMEGRELKTELMFLYAQIWMEIRKSQKPRCLKHVKSLHGTSEHNGGTWIVCMLFMELLTS
jgi:hypothetical protein